MYMQVMLQEKTAEVERLSREVKLNESDIKMLEYVSATNAACVAFS